MQWFAGNVQTAIQISRKNRALLIVYISTDTEDGRRFDGFWEHIDAGNLQCPVVGIKLKAGETAAHQFADIYPTPILPAAYLIDQSGKPLEVITSLVGTEYDQFRGKFDRGVTEFVKNLGEAAAPAPQAPAPTPVAQAPPPPAPVAPEPANTEMSPELAEKVRRAKELLEQKKQKELQKQKEAEKHQKEEMAKALKAKQERDDKALLEAAKQRKLEKLEATKEKERILAQIKADRENAQKRFGSGQKTEKSGETAAPAPVKALGQAVPSDRCRLQIRLPDGSTFVEEFPSNDVLNSLVEIIRQKLAGSKSFEITQPYPRRVFSVDDYSKTFLENQLTPSTALVVVLKPSQAAAVSSAITTQTGSIFSLILSPVWLVWNFFCGMLGWNSGSGAGEPKKQETTAAGAQGAQGAPRQRGMPRSAEVRRRGNVAGFVNPNEDDPEERANFNGNSTQFM